MIIRFNSRRPDTAVRLHGQLNIFSCLFLVAIFALGFFAVGPERSLTNPHHGLGVAIFVLFLLQLVGGRLIVHITKSRSLRIMIHQWSGRTIALLGIVQIPLGLTLYGSPLYLFVLYTLWMVFLLVVYFILSYIRAGRRELNLRDGRSEAGRSRVNESEYFASEHEKKERRGGWMRWLAPLAAGAGLWAWLRNRGNRNRGRDGSRSPSLDRSRRPEVIPSRRGSGSFVEEEKYSDLPPPRKSGGGFMKVLGGAAAAVGAGALVSNFMNRRADRRRDEEYSAVSTETPRRHRPARGTGVYSEYGTDITGDPRRDGTDTSLLPPSAQPPAMAGAISAADSRLGSRRPVTPRQSHVRPAGAEFEDSEYSSYVSPSRRPPEERQGGRFAEGIMAGLGMGWISRRLEQRRARKQENRIMEEEEMRAGSQGSRFTGDGYPSPTRRDSRRPPVRRQTGFEEPARTEMTESTIEDRAGDGYGPPAPAPPVHAEVVPAILTPGHGRGHSRSRLDAESTSMPAMPPDTHGVFHSEAEGSYSSVDRPGRAVSSRRRRDGERAAAVAAARASDLAVTERDRYGSPHSQPVSVKLNIHDDRDRNVTLRRLTEEEAQAARGQRSRGDSESSLSGMESPSQGRRYRRESSQRRAEIAAERRAEGDQLGPLSPPNPAFARSRRGKDSAYYSGQPGPSGGSPAAGQTVSSLGSMASPESHGAMSPSQSGADRPGGSAAADNRRRRRLERRRGSSSRPTGSDMFE